MKKIIALSALAVVLGAITAPAALSQTRRDDLSPGDVVRDHSAAVVVPRRGVRVEAWVTTVTGYETLTVETKEDGSVFVEHEGDEDSYNDEVPDEESTPSPEPAHTTTEEQSAAEGSVSAALSTDECLDDVHAAGTTKETNTHSWYFKVSSTPTGLDQTSARNQMIYAMNNIVNEYNVCSRADSVLSTHSYAGDTTANTEIDDESVCTAGDSVNERAFGNLEVGTLAVTCGYGVNDELVEADVKLNKVVYDWTLNPGSGCSGKWDIQSIATHESGHVFGLGHPLPEGDHPQLTMGGPHPSCATRQRSLGLGDMLGLELLY